MSTALTFLLPRVCPLAKPPPAVKCLSLTFNTCEGASSSDPCLFDVCHGARSSRCNNGSWFNHVLEWWEAANADPEHVLFLTYEQMLADPEEQIRKIADFAGIVCTAETLAKASAVVQRVSQGRVLIS